MRTFTVTFAQIAACPLGSLLPAHFNDDGTCKCIVGGTLAATSGYVCATCGAQAISSVPTERCGPFGCENGEQR